jgi:4-hydroxy-4-methyl-2-oxoglutarate aldolase
MRADIAAMGTSTLYEAAGQRGALPSAIRPMTRNCRFAGSAVTVSGPPGDNLWLHRGLYKCRPGDTLVATVGGAYEWGYWGEILSFAARELALAGVVIDGCVRDLAQIDEVGIPVFGRGASIRGTAKHADGVGAINDAIVLGNAVVNPGDWIVGDEDGLVVIPVGRAESVIERGKERLAKESIIMAALRVGKRTLDLYDLPA